MNIFKLQKKIFPPQNKKYFCGHWRNKKRYTYHFFEYIIQVYNKNTGLGVFSIVLCKTKNINGGLVYILAWRSSKFKIMLKVIFFVNFKKLFLMHFSSRSWMSIHLVGKCVNRISSIVNRQSSIVNYQNSQS